MTSSGLSEPGVDLCMSASFNDRDFRNAMGQFCTGVVIVTGISDGQPVGFSAQSFVSVSLSPPLVSICPARTSTSWPRLRAARNFGINILASDQFPVCAGFARTGVDKFADLSWTASSRGVPVLGGVIGFIDCELEAEHEAGDHTLVVARVHELKVFSADSSPLLFFRGAYGDFAALEHR